MWSSGFHSYSIVTSKVYDEPGTAPMIAHVVRVFFKSAGNFTPMFCELVYQGLGFWPQISAHLG
jgi:hypothetical protein